MRIKNETTRLPRIARGRSLTVLVNGKPVTAYEGETVAAVLLVEGFRAFRHMPASAEPRGLYCGMGICYECLVTVDGMPNVRACVTSLRDGMTIEAGAQP